MPTLNTFSAWITVDGEKLPEFSNDASIYSMKAQAGEEDPLTVSCWIPSETGKNISIHWETTNFLFSFIYDVFIDGIKVDRGWHRFVKRRRGITIDGKTNEVATSETTLRPLVFSPVETTDDDGADPQEAQCREIKVEINEVAVSKKLVPNGPSQSFRPAIVDALLTDTPVHETSAKGLKHRIQLGPERTVPSRKKKQILKQEEKEKSREKNKMIMKMRIEGTVRRVATFIFYYRPLSLLQANGVAPPPARESDVKANAIKHDSDETSKKIEDTEAKIAKLQEEVRRLKDKKVLNEEDTKPSASFLKIQRPNGKPIFVDLTLDDD